MPKVSVVITCHNYGNFLAQAIDSVLDQTFDDFELIVVDDGSTDHTQEVLSTYNGQSKFRLLQLSGIGLAAAANAGIRKSEGEYVIRLDADDYFDENILLVLTNVLDRQPEYGMVFPDYYEVTRYGEIIHQVRQPRVNDEVKLLDRSALAAGALYRRSCFDTLGGYSEELRRQEDYDFWIRFVDRYRVHNVQIPLMYYRQHGRSMSMRGRQERMEARRYVKDKFVSSSRAQVGRSVLCVLPMVAENRFRHRLPLLELNGRPLFSYILEAARSAGVFDRIVIDTEDDEIAEAARAMGADVPYLRPRSLARLDSGPGGSLAHLVNRLAEEERYMPDYTVMAFYTYPFVRAEHLKEAIDTLMIHQCDSVISVTPDPRFHWQPGEHGLVPLSFPRKQLLDLRDTVFEERGGIYALKGMSQSGDGFLGNSISHIELSEVESLRIESEYSLWLAQQVAASGKTF